MDVCTCHLGRSTWCQTHGWNRDHLTVVGRKPPPDPGSRTHHIPVTRPPGVKRRIREGCIEDYGGHTRGPNNCCARCGEQMPDEAAR